jgi:hypothetical protein
MQRLLIDRSIVATNVTLRTRPNWTVVLFFAGLCALHAYMAISALVHKHFETFMSLILAIGFGIVALVFWRIRREMTFVQESRQLRVRTGLHRLYYERLIPFADIRGVRLTLLHPRDPKAATIELVCDREVIECPPTTVPRQEALCLAMTMNVHLTKVYGDSFGPVAERLDQIPMN